MSQSRWYSIGNIFRQNKNIVAFAEFELFTGVESIYSAFNGCSNLASLVLPHNITSIGTGSLYGLSITELTIPAKVTNIGSQGIYSNSKLTEITLLPTTPPTINANCQMPATIYVPAASLEAYKTASVWSTWASKMVAIPE